MPNERIRPSHVLLTVLAISCACLIGALLVVQSQVNSLERGLADGFDAIGTYAEPDGDTTEFLLAVFPGHDGDGLRWREQKQSVTTGEGSAIATGDPNVWILRGSDGGRQGVLHVVRTDGRGAGVAFYAADISAPSFLRLEKVSADRIGYEGYEGAESFGTDGSG